MATTLIKKLKFGTGNWDYIEIHAGTTVPEGNISAPSGSIYLYTNTTGGSAGAIFHKTTLSDVNTGWINIKANATTTVKGLVNQSAKVDDVASPNATDLATAITLINELKTKLNAKLSADRTSGQQSTT